MIKLLIIFFAAMFLAAQSEKYSRSVLVSGRTHVPRRDTALILLILALTLFAGLRTQYNDTAAYVRDFNSAPGIREFLSDPENLNPFTNPLFYAYQSFLRSLGCSAQVLIFTASLLTQTCFLRFFKRYSRHFTFSIFIYFTLGTFCVSLAAMKQVAAMAVLTLAIPCLERKRWGRFYFVVFVAMLIHTYALAFAILPFFMTRPWKLNTLLLLLGVVFLLSNFREIISEFMEQANALGKTLEDYEVFDSHTINRMRLLVYAVPPLISLVFRRWVNHDASVMEHLMIQMSIVSFSFMMLGTQSGANMFARMAHYFEIGTICCLPRMINQPFELKTRRALAVIAVVCYIGFFVYANAISGSFDEAYRATNLFPRIF